MKRYFQGLYLWPSLSIILMLWMIPIIFITRSWWLALPLIPIIILADLTMIRQLSDYDRLNDKYKELLGKQ